MWLTYALLAALSFGFRGILYHWTSQRLLNRNLLLCGVFATGAVVNLMMAVVFGSPWSLSCLVGIQMGLFSFAANASMFKGFAVGKASLVAILTALPSVLVVFAAFLFWNERLHSTQIIAFLIIVGGVLLVRYSNEIALNNLQGAQWGLLAMLFFACNDLSGKWSTVLEAELFPTMFFMFAAGTICFGLWWLSDMKRSRALRGASALSETAAASEAEAAIPSAAPPAPIPWSVRRTFLIGMAVGTTNAVGMLLILTAFDLGKAGLVSAVVALNVPIVLLYTRFVVKERFSRTELTGILLSVAGILMMRLFGT
ncbi:EamA family transporter [Paenibacillus sp. HB172176]|uniref:EamA family transporter n=1 Tax=Paenibacillus sp. HB172176 TaxID=2493690 RepID=UPI00143CB426|nr:EamA family transporter [Paenibacillus sp. HB172176]